MSQSAHIALVQLEQALNNLQNSMVDETGALTVSREWFDIFDTVLIQLIQTRNMADIVNKAAVNTHQWDKALSVLQ